MQAGCDFVADVIGSGIIPGGMEMMDNKTIVATENYQPCGYPRDAGSLVIVELDGTSSEVDHLIDKVSGIAAKHEASTVKVSTSDAERLQFWQGRKNAFPAVGAVGPDYLCMDGSIPRSKLGYVLERMEQLGERYGLRVANVFHAGDGNLHPLILYDAAKPGDTERAEAFGSDILRLCVEVGGVLTGEHGVGVEKRDLMGTMFTEVDLQQQQRLKCAFDPEHRLNPGKVFPTLHRCAELGPHARPCGQGGLSRAAEVLEVGRRSQQQGEAGAGRQDQAQPPEPGRRHPRAHEAEVNRPKHQGGETEAGEPPGLRRGEQHPGDQRGHHGDGVVQPAIPGAHRQPPAHPAEKRDDDCGVGGECDVERGRAEAEGAVDQQAERQAPERHEPGEAERQRRNRDRGGREDTRTPPL